jgi:hypothetical protein
MNPFEFVLAIIIITTIGGIMKARMGGGGRGSWGRRERFVDDDGRRDYDESPESIRLKEEVRMLKERIQTLERITVDKESSLAREIDDLRNR